MKISFFQKISRELLKTTDDRIKSLSEIGIFNIEDLLEYFPRDYVDFSKPKEISELRADQKNFLIGHFEKKIITPSPRGKLKLTKAIFVEQNSNEKIECVWFADKTIFSRIPIDKKISVCARAKLNFGKVSLQNPEFEFFSENLKFGRITPIYREHKILKPNWFLKKISEILSQISKIPEILPTEIIKSENLFSRSKYFQQIHFPENFTNLEKAKKSINFEKLFLLQLTALRRKKKWQNSAKKNRQIFLLDSELQKKFFSTLPFTPTNSQKIAIFEILKDLEKKFPMMRILEGDVGSGKTLVAIAASLPILKNNGQVAFLAPTEILANQHFLEISKFLNNFRFKIT